VPLDGSVVLLGAPLVWLGVTLGFALACASLWLRGVRWRELGLRCPGTWIRTILTSIGVTVAVMAVLIVLSDIVVRTFPNGAPVDDSRFDPLRGHLPNLLINLVAVWPTDGFVEEMMWRGYLMNRLADLVGQTKLAWGIALIGSAAIFGIAHAYQGPSGIAVTGVAGLLFWDRLPHRRAAQPVDPGPRARTDRYGELCAHFPERGLADRAREP